MNILVLASRFPYPAKKGDQQRLLHMLEELGQRHAIYMVCTAESPVDADMYQAVSRYLTELVVVPLPPWQRFISLLTLPWLRRLPFEVAYFYSWPMQRQVKRILARVPIDVVFCQMLRSAPYMPARRLLPVVVDYQDAYSLNMQRRYATEKGLVKWIAFVEWKMLRWYEQWLLRRISAATIVSQRDKAALGDPLSMSVVPIGVGVPPKSSPKISHRLVFSGNLRYFPNRDAISWFCREIYPLIIEQVPGVSLDIVGASPPEDILSLAGLPGVSVYADVPSVQPFLSQAAVSVVPIRSGSGTQFKVLEALSARTPVVASDHAYAGLDFISRESVVVSECQPEAFADAVVSLLRDEPRRQRMATKGCDEAQQFYGWSRIADQFEEVLRQAIDSHFGARQ